MPKIGDLVRNKSHALWNPNLVGIITERNGLCFTVRWLDQQGGLYDYEWNELEVVGAKE